jgi:hypothetical protein
LRVAVPELSEAAFATEDDMKVKEKLRPEETRVARIRELNDSFRSSFQGGRVMLTSGVAALEEKAKAAVLEAIRTFDGFNADNDPHGEHDMCFVEVGGDKYWSKVDYYDTDIRYGADDPSDPAHTTRIMTIGHASEY